MKQAIIHLHESWKIKLKDQWEKEYFKKLGQFLQLEAKKNKIYPCEADYFNAFNETPFKNVKVVVLGQDPYHKEGQAHGLSFSVKEGVKTPPSLVNIYKELHSDIGMPPPQSGNLEGWAQQGVLLLNATLSVAAGKAGSHQKKGWEPFTDHVIDLLNRERKNLVFFLWGSFAQKKGKNIDRDRHLVLEAPHPSPLSVYRGFWGCKHFSKANEYLVSQGLEPIDWSQTCVENLTKEKK